MRLAMLFIGLTVAMGQAGSLTYLAVTNNADKGIMPYTLTSVSEKANFPHTLEFAYCPLRSLMTGPSTFVWTEIDGLLSDGSSNGCRLVLRVYADWPDNRVNRAGVLTNGLPQYLIDGGLTTYAYTNQGNATTPDHTSLSPNYEDANFQTAITNFVAAFGARYDGDARIACVQLGLLGWWGEWHTGGAPRGDPAYPEFASTNFQAKVISAYTNAFHSTKLQIRYATGPSSSSAFADIWTMNDAFPIGQHDDAFAHDTFGVSSYTLGMQQSSGSLWTNHWKTSPIGGELYPNDGKQYCIWNDSPCVDGSQTFDASSDSLHASYALAHLVFASDNPSVTNATVRARALASIQHLGYELYAKSWSASGNVLSIIFTNTGVAPFYYDWPISVRAISGTTTNTFVTNWKLTQVVPGDGAVTNTVTLTNLAKGTWALSMKATNPLTNGFPLCFANATQDTNTGWLALGNLDWLEVTHRVSGGVTMSGGVKVQ